MEEKKKLSTAEILARARAQKAAAAGESAPAPTENPAEPESSAAAAPAATPKSTKDILAAARAAAAAKAAGGEGAAPAAKPAASETPKPAAGGPKSTKDILAAARAAAAAKAAGGDAPAEAAPAAATKKPAKAPAAGGDTPSVQEMLKAVREGKSEAPAEVEKPPVAAKIPQKPPAPTKPGAKLAAKPGAAAPRRNFLLAFLAAPFAIAWTLLSISGLAALLGAARFMFPNAIVEPPSKFKVGPPGDYSAGTVSNKWKAMFGIWIVNAEYQGRQLIYALSTVCTHLGCTPSWLDGEQKFKCPCHGSGFYITGVNFEGPAPRPLERYAIRVSEDGMLEVDKSQKFQQEMGQWDDTKSYVEVA